MNLIEVVRKLNASFIILCTLKGSGLKLNEQETSWGSLSGIQDAVDVQSVFIVCVFLPLLFFFWVVLAVKVWLTGPLFDCQRGWDQEHTVRGQMRILSLEPVSHEPFHSKRDHVRLGNTHSIGITSPPLVVSLGWWEQTGFKTTHISFSLLWVWTGHVCKATMTCLLSQKYYPDCFKNWVQICRT